LLVFTEFVEGMEGVVVSPEMPVSDLGSHPASANAVTSIANVYLIFIALRTEFDSSATGFLDSPGAHARIDARGFRERTVQPVIRRALARAMPQSRQPVLPIKLRLRSKGGFNSHAERKFHQQVRVAICK